MDQDHHPAQDSSAQNHADGQIGHNDAVSTCLQRMFVVLDALHQICSAIGVVRLGLTHVIGLENDAVTRFVIRECNAYVSSAHAIFVDAANNMCDYFSQTPLNLLPTGDHGTRLFLFVQILNDILQDGLWVRSRMGLWTPASETQSSFDDVDAFYSDLSHRTIAWQRQAWHARLLFNLAYVFPDSEQTQTIQNQVDAERESTEGVWDFEAVIKWTTAFGHVQTLHQRRIHENETTILRNIIAPVEPQQP